MVWAVVGLVVEGMTNTRAPTLRLPTDTFACPLSTTVDEFTLYESVEPDEVRTVTRPFASAVTVSGVTPMRFVDELAAVCTLAVPLEFAMVALDAGVALVRDALGADALVEPGAVTWLAVTPSATAATAATTHVPTRCARCLVVRYMVACFLLHVCHEGSHIMPTQPVSLVWTG